MRTIPMTSKTGLIRKELEKQGIEFRSLEDEDRLITTWLVGGNQFTFAEFFELGGPFPSYCSLVINDPSVEQAIAITLSEKENSRLTFADRLKFSKYTQKINIENAKLRKLSEEMYPYAKAFLQQGVTLGCCDTKSYDWGLQLLDLGVEVDA